MAAGPLLRVLPRASGGEVGLWLVYPGRHLPAASRALAEFIVNELPEGFAESSQNKHRHRPRVMQWSANDRRRGPNFPRPHSHSIVAGGLLLTS